MKRSKSQNARRSRRKGHQFERDVAIALRLVFPEARRHLEYQDAESGKGIDLVETGYYRFQCKKLADYAPINRIREVQCDEELGEVPVLVTAADGKEPMAVLPFTHLLRLIRKDVAGG
jgi:hypothetical protein